MRIFQIINHAGLDRGGAERLARGLHQDLRAAGHDARLIALEACDLDGLEDAVSLGFASPRDPRGALALARVLRRDLRPGDVVHAHLFPSTLYVSALKRARMIRVPCAMTEHNTWNRRRGHAPGRALDRTVYGGFDRIATISDQTEAALLQSQPSCAERTQVVINGTRLLFDKVPVRARARNPPVILSMGRLVRAKNYPAALKALARLTDRPWRYHIAGAGPDEAELRAQMRALGLEERVVFLGHVGDIQSVLEEADLFLMPSLWEGFGLAAVEAMNAGLPVVASDVPGLREVVAPTGAPLVAPDDCDALASAIARLLDDPGLRATLGGSGHDAACAYGRDRMARDYLSMWRELTGAGMGNGA